MIQLVYGNKISYFNENLIVIQIPKKAKNKEWLFSRHDGEKESIRNKYYINFTLKHEL